MQHSNNMDMLMTHVLIMSDDDVKKDLDTISMPPPASQSKSGPHVMIPVVLVVL